MYMKCNIRYEGNKYHLNGLVYAVVKGENVDTPDDHFFVRRNFLVSTVVSWYQKTKPVGNNYIVASEIILIEYGPKVRGQ